MRKCIYLPWHNLRVNKRWKEMGGYQVKCSCGKLYAMNDDVRTILDWDEDYTEYIRQKNARASTKAV